MNGELEKFNGLFSRLGELCFSMYMVERPLGLFDFTAKDNQIINPYYFVEVKKRHPDALKGFYMAMKKQGENLQFFLLQSGVAVEYLDSSGNIVKTDIYASVEMAARVMPGYIHYLTKDWDPLKN